MKTPLLLRYVIWSMFIFAVSMVLLSFRGLRSLELKAIDFSFSRRYYVDVDRKKEREADVPFKIISFYELMPQELFFESAIDITRHLKEVGARVVIIPLPSQIRPSPKNLRVVQELANEKIVVFGVPAQTLTRYPDSDPRPEDKQYWWAAHPLYHRTNITWGAMTGFSNGYSLLTRFVPTGIHDDNTGEAVPDVMVLALKRYFDIPDNSELPLSPSRLHIGPYAFPIEHDGLSYLRVSLWGGRVVELYSTHNPANDSLMYFPAYPGSPADTAVMNAAWRAHAGKIVLIDWNRGESYRYPTPGWAYYGIARAFFNRSFVKVHNEWNVLLIITLVILLSVVSYIVRNGFMIFLSLALAAASVVLSAWLFNSQNVLFEPVYIIVPILLCGSILPIAKTAGEKRIAEERAKSLEEENRRLRELQQSTPPGTHF